MPGVSAPSLRISSRAPGWMKLWTKAGGRPCSVNASASAVGQPSRAQASAKADGAGTTVISSAEMKRDSVTPTP